MIPISCKISWINATQEHDQLNSNKGLISHCSTRSVLGRVTCLESLNIAVSNVCDQRLRWSRGSELPLSTQVRGLKPDRSRQDFQGRKIFSAPSFGGEVKPSVPCRRFTACKRSLNVAWKSTFRQNYWLIFSPTSSPFATWIFRVVWTWRHLAAKVGTSKT